MTETQTMETGTQAGTTTFAPDDHLPAGVTNVHLAEILFCSSLQASQHPDAADVRAALWLSLRTRDGRVNACAEELAEAYGKDPESTCSRMRWCRDLVAQFFPNVPAFG